MGTKNEKINCTFLALKELKAHGHNTRMDSSVERHYRWVDPDGRMRYTGVRVGWLVTSQVASLVPRLLLS